MPTRGPAFYAARPGGLRDWWTILHLPYTAWHLSYVVLGASLAPHVDGVRLFATVLAFFFAVGISAHALDELHGHPLGTLIPDLALRFVAIIGLAAAVAVGIAGLSRVGPILIPFLVLGPALVISYNLELFGGHIHNDVGFAASWGAFPVLTAYVAQAERLDPEAVAGAAAAFALAYAQRALSGPARLLRRQVHQVQGSVTMADGSTRDLNNPTLLKPLERALRALSWGMVALAVALALARLS